MGREGEEPALTNSFFTHVRQVPSYCSDYKDARRSKTTTTPQMQSVSRVLPEHVSDWGVRVSFTPPAECGALMAVHVGAQTGVREISKQHHLLGGFDS